jgi:prevent-host-death family protein
MEKMVEIEVIQPRLGEYLKQVENGEVIIVTSASEPKGVIMGYDMYNEMKAIAQKTKRLELTQIVNSFRTRAEEAGLIENDVLKEIEKLRK